jgi:proton-dependent oligopeptide transporter, POT family
MSVRYSESQSTSGFDIEPTISAAEVKVDHGRDEKNFSVDLIPSKQPDLYGVHGFSGFPTEEERQSLRRIADKIPWNAYRQHLALFCDPADFLIRVHSYSICRISRTILVLWKQCRFCTFRPQVSGMTPESEFVPQTNFIQQPLPSGSRTGAGGANGQSGALNMGQRTSTGLSTFYQFWFVVIDPIILGPILTLRIGAMLRLSLAPTLPTPTGVVTKLSAGL